MKTLLLALTTAFLLLAAGCKKDSPTEPQPTKPPGYQEDIPWKSLADSPWPMNHHDPQNTGRSSFKGPRKGNISKVIDIPEVMTGIVVDIDSNFYFTSSDPNQNISGLYALEANGNVKWKYTNTSSCWTTPIISASGKIYFMDLHRVYSVSRNGKLNWEYQKEFNPASVISFSMGKNGDLFFLDQNRKLFSISNQGNLNWVLADNNLFASFFNNLVFSPDGNTIYTLGWGTALIAINTADGSIKWKFGEGRGINQYTPFIDSEGNIYMQALSSTGDTAFYSIKDNGSIRWEIKLAGSIFYGGTIDKKGNIYIASDTLYCINYNGEITWKLPLGGFNDIELINDIDGYIFAGVLNSVTKKTELMCINPTGTLLWEMEFEHGLSTSPALIDGALYISEARNKKLYIIE